MLYKMFLYLSVDVLQIFVLFLYDNITSQLENLSTIYFKTRYKTYQTQSFRTDVTGAFPLSSESPRQSLK